MITDRRMKFIKTIDGFDLYIFRPTFLRQYYNKSEEWTPHRKSITHKIHMALYYLLGGYSVLYMLNGADVAAYVIFTRCGNTVIEGTTRNDIYTIFVTTHPDYRRRGLATKLIYEMLHGLNLRFESSYKTIEDDNAGSQKAAFSNQYTMLYPVNYKGIGC